VPDDRVGVGDELDHSSRRPIRLAREAESSDLAFR
jgi:hypothetical protein